jgi:hypothetical protein
MWAFDLIELNGDDLRRDPLQVRKATLASILAKARPGIRSTSISEGDGQTVFAHACKMGLEGIVSKRLGSPYRSGRPRPRPFFSGRAGFLVSSLFGRGFSFARMTSRKGKAQKIHRSGAALQSCWATAARVTASIIVSAPASSLHRHPSLAQQARGQ